MDLLKSIKKSRSKRKQKQPFKQDVFSRISAIVRQHGLKESFLNLLDNVVDNPDGTYLLSSRIMIKPHVENHLFFLATKEEYSLTMSIIGKVDNPYLKFAKSPEEIILSGPLYQLNPSMDSKKLIRYHFKTLYLHGLSKTLNQDCENG